MVPTSPTSLQSNASRSKQSIYQTGGMDFPGTSASEPQRLPTDSGVFHLFCAGSALGSVNFFAQEHPSHAPSGRNPSFKCDAKIPASPSINSRIMLAFVSLTHSIRILPSEFHRDRYASLRTLISIYLALLIKGVRPLEQSSEALTPYSKRAPFYIASANRTS